MLIMFFVFFVFYYWNVYGTGGLISLPARLFRSTSFPKDYAGGLSSPAYSFVGHTLKMLNTSLGQIWINRTIGFKM